MKKFVLTALFMCLLFGSFVYAQTEGEMTDETRELVYRSAARGLVDRAVTLIELSGCEQAFDACGDSRRPLAWRDLYIFVVDMDGSVLAHGAQNDMIGKNIMYRRDSYGRPIIKDMIEKSMTDTEGWINYKWRKPMTRSISNKSIYFRKIGDNLVCCEYCQ